MHLENALENAWIALENAWTAQNACTVFGYMVMGFESVRIWISQDLDLSVFGSLAIRISHDLDPSGFGSLRI